MAGQDTKQFKAVNDNLPMLQRSLRVTPGAVNSLETQFCQERWLDIVDLGETSANGLIKKALVKIEEDIKNYEVFMKMLKGVVGIQGVVDKIIEICPLSPTEGADSRATVHHGREQVDGPTHGSASQSATAVHGQEQTEGPKQHEKMRENIDELKKMYAELSSHAAREMSSKDYKFRRSSLYYLPNPKKEHKDDVEEAIEKAKSADDDVIDVFEEHHDYLNYLLLKHIIDSFGSDELKKRMADYVTRMEAFRKETRLEIFSKFTCDHPKEACGDECTIVFDMDWATATLDDMEQFRATFCRGLSLQDFSLSLLKVSKGCVRSSWRIPRMLWPYIKKYSPALLTYLVGKTTIININIGGQQSLQPPGRT
jgi:hypothetical protein